MFELLPSADLGLMLSPVISLLGIPKAKDGYLQLRAIKVHDSVSEHAAPFPCSFSSVRIQHFLAAFLPTCDVLQYM